MTREGEISIVRAFSQSEFDRFAGLSGDNNPIHVDPEFSARTRFGRPVAHGLLLCSVLRGLIERLAPGGRVAEQAVMFPAPTFAGEPMRFTVRTRGDSFPGDDLKQEFELEVRRIADDVTTCRGSAWVVS